MIIKQRKISELIPAEYNPRRLSSKQFNDLQKSFKKLGTLEPAVVNMIEERKNVIISGHQRLKVAESLGMAEYPCVEVSFPIEKEKEANIRMNQNTGSWDMDILANCFDNTDLLDFGFSEEELCGLEFGVEDIKNVEDVNENINFIVVCEDIEELEQFKSKLNIQCNKMKCVDFLNKIKL